MAESKLARYVIEKWQHFVGCSCATSVEISDSAIDRSRDRPLVPQEISQGVVCQYSQRPAGALRELAQRFVDVVVEPHAPSYSSHATM